MDWVLKKIGTIFLFQTVYSGHLKTFRTDICLRSTQSNKTYLGLHSMKQQYRYSALDGMLVHYK